MDLSLVNQAENTSSTTSVTDTKGLSSESHKADSLKGYANAESNRYGEKTLCDRVIDMMNKALDDLSTKIYNIFAGKPTPAQLKDFRLGLIREIGHHLDQKGIYRISAKKDDVDQLMAKQRETIPQGTLSGDLAVSALKQSLKDAPLFPPGVALEKTAHLFEGSELRSKVSRAQLINTLTEGMSNEDKIVFEALIDSLQQVAKNSDRNEMPVSNLATTPGAALFPVSEKSTDVIGDIAKTQALVTKLLTEESPEKLVHTNQTDWQAAFE